MIAASTVFAVGLGAVSVTTDLPEVASGGWLPTTLAGAALLAMAARAREAGRVRPTEADGTLAPFARGAPRGRVPGGARPVDAQRAAGPRAAPRARLPPGGAGDGAGPPPQAAGRARGGPPPRRARGASGGRRRLRAEDRPADPARLRPAIAGPRPGRGGLRRQPRPQPARGPGRASRRRPGGPDARRPAHRGSPRPAPAPRGGGGSAPPPGPARGPRRGGRAAGRGGSGPVGWTPGTGPAGAPRPLRPRARVPVRRGGGEPTAPGDDPVPPSGERSGMATAARPATGWPAPGARRSCMPTAPARNDEAARGRPRLAALPSRPVAFVACRLLAGASRAPCAREVATGDAPSPAPGARSPARHLGDSGRCSTGSWGWWRARATSAWRS